MDKLIADDADLVECAAKEMWDADPRKVFRGKTRYRTKVKWTEAEVYEQNRYRELALAALAAIQPRADREAEGLLRVASRVLMHHYKEWDGEPEDVIDIRQVAADIDAHLKGRTP